MVWGIIEFVLFAIGIVLFAALVITNINLRFKNQKLKAQLTQEAIDRGIVMQKLAEAMAQQDRGSLEKTDGFLKFISESRDAAFNYIEEVQKAINDFKVIVGPVVEHYKGTGKILQRKPSELVKDLSEAYDKLMEAMPKEDNV